MRIRIMLFVVLLMLNTSADAQRKKKVVRQPTPTAEELKHKDKMERMTANTAQVMFIDSFVINKSNFLSRYILNPEAGRIDNYQKPYNTLRQPNAYVYINELGNRCFLSQENNEGIINLYSSERVDNKWTRQKKLKGINDQKTFRRVNYPFMLGDGETLYFAAEGDDGLGGYDIYTSTYDKESQRFLQPVNIGMPFNSKANDYMFVIDEYSNLGWFASDRNQAADTVCIYVFVPESRKSYDSEKYTPEQIAGFARITSIADTWIDKQKLDQAQARLQMTRDRSHQTIKGRDFIFVINDDITYYQLSDFKEPNNVRRYHELSSLRASYSKLIKALQQARDYWSSAPKDEIDELRTEILATEKSQLSLYQRIHDKEKEIRNNEIFFLTKNK
jgi:hypothetical protein